MSQFRFSISADKWPSEYTVEAGSWPTATARAVRLWKSKEGKGSRTTQIVIKGVKVIAKSLDKDLAKV